MDVYTNVKQYFVTCLRYIFRKKMEKWLSEKLRTECSILKGKFKMPEGIFNIIKESRITMERKTKTILISIHEKHLLYENRSVGRFITIPLGLSFVLLIKLKWYCLTKNKCLRTFNDRGSCYEKLFVMLFFL